MTIHKQQSTTTTPLSTKITSSMRRIPLPKMDDQKKITFLLFLHRNRHAFFYKRTYDYQLEFLYKNTTEQVKYKRFTVKSNGNTIFSPRIDDLIDFYDESYFNEFIMGDRVMDGYPKPVEFKLKKCHEFTATTDVIQLNEEEIQNNPALFNCIPPEIVALLYNRCFK